MSDLHFDDPNYGVDPRFDEAESEVARGESWLFRDDDAPNPLTILVTGWSSGHTRIGEAEFLNGTDRTGHAWSILVGSSVLQRRLIDGEVSEWDDETHEYKTVRTEGRVQPGEVVSIRYKGEKESSNGMTYPNFEVSRKPALQEASVDAPPFE